MGATSTLTTEPTDSVDPRSSKYILFSNPSSVPPGVHPSIRIHLCPLTVAAATLNAAVCQEACSVTFMVTACKTEGIMGMCGWVGGLRVRTMGQR
ncbi:hypothetical protein VZT92_026868 [Zoarces viviparus]|uniref:Uncharacterized protein n=1 Tax=Zoarces viviparus TaxID=48416 RepID=A0AAW1DUH6_ZOAVI